MVHKTARPTLLYVTHDQTEALTFADEIIVMEEGRVLQIGSPQELFEDPRHRFVGRFIGSPGMNFLPCRIASESAFVGPIAIPLRAGSLCEGEGYELGIRPEFLRFCGARADGAVPVQIRSVTELGNHKIVSVALREHAVKVRVPDSVSLPAGDAYLEFPSAWTLVFRDGERVA